MSGITVGQFDFDDGGTYCGGSDGGKAHGFGVCTGPGGQGEYSGAWQSGFELSGVYTWPNGNDYAGQWMQGKRHGLGMERRGHWVYRGEWTQGFMGRYGVRQSTLSEAKYEGTWTSGLHDGYGLETYSDGGTYQGQWMKGMRHGYGVRKSAPQKKAALCRSTKVRRSSLTSVRSEVETSEQQTIQEHSHSHHLTAGHAHHSQSTDQSTSPRIGFFLKGKIPEKSTERRGSFLSRQSPAFSHLKRHHGQNNANSNLSEQSAKTDDDEEGLVEMYTGEWKNDKRSGFGVCERSDGLRYEGEWLENCKNGYGITMFADGTKEEGKYKNNVLLEPSKKMLLLSAKKIREQIDAAVSSALKAAQIAIQKSDIANSRMESARSKAELALEFIEKARRDSEKARQQAREVVHSDPNASNVSSQTKITKRLSIPRHNMLDIQPEQIQFQQQQHHQLNANAVNHIQSSIRQKSIKLLDQTSYNSNVLESPNHGESYSNIQHSNRRQLSSIVEGSLQNLSEEVQEAQVESLPLKHKNRTSWQRLDEPDYSQMNHVSPSSLNMHPKNPVRQLSEQMPVNAVPQQLSFSSPVSSSQLQLSPSQVSEEDHLAEIENIFSYLADEEKDMMEHGYTGSPVEASQHSSLLSRPSLRYRRDVRCQNLLISNQQSESYVKPAPVKRRLTLPSIVKYGTAGPVMGRGTGILVASNDKEAVPEPTSSIETIVIDNGVRKRLEEEIGYRPPPLPSNIDPIEEILEHPKELPKRYRLESVRLTKKSELGSLPNVSMFHQLEGRAIPRQEAEMLCKLKREELQQIRELEDQMRRRAVVLKIGDFKEWCRRHELTIFLIAVNLMLAALFSKLLSS